MKIRVIRGKEGRCPWCAKIVVKTRDRLNAIMGPRRYRDPSARLNHKAIWHAYLEAKHLGTR
ncbi:hypothetical protein [Desulfosoma sp.]